MPDKRRLKFRFIAVTYEEDFFNVVKRGMGDAAAAMHVDCDFVGSRGVDAAEMSALARDALDRGYDGLAIDIFDADAFRPVIAEASARGVPVVGFNINAGNGSAGNLSSVVQDFSAAGRALGRRAAEHVAVGASAIITMHDAGISALEERRDGIMAELALRNVIWTECITSHHPDEAAEKILAAVTPRTTAILATGQADLEGAAIAARRSARPLYVAGFDLSPRILAAIADGVVDCTVDQQPYTQGFYPVVQLALAVRYGLVPQNLDAGAAIIDAGNVADVVALAAQGYR